MDLSLFRQRSSILGKQLSVEILGYLRSNPYSIASQVARRFDIHIATAAKYLTEMEKAKLVASRIRETGRKPAKEYYLLSDKITLEIDLSKISRNDPFSRLSTQRVRERRSENIAYEWDSERSLIKEIVILEQDKGRKRVRKVPLDDVEGRFLWHLPLPSQDFKTASEIALQSGLSDPKDLEKIERLLDHLVELGVVERQPGA